MSDTPNSDMPGFSWNAGNTSAPGDFSEEIAAGALDDDPLPPAPHRAGDVDLYPRSMVLTYADAAVAAALAAASPVSQAPIDMVLFCPACGAQHIDSPERSLGPENTERLDWDNPPHRSHLCSSCNHIWRPADVPTNGVEAVKTKGKADSARPAAASSADAVTADLLQIARDTGLRQHLHGVNAQDARELLARFVAALPAAAPAQPTSTDIAQLAIDLWVMAQDRPGNGFAYAVDAIEERLRAALAAQPVAVQAAPEPAEQPVYEPRVEWINEHGQHNSLSIAEAARQLMAWDNEWPGGLEEVTVALATSRASTPQSDAVQQGYGTVIVNGSVVCCEDFDREPCPRDPVRRCATCPGRPTLKGQP